MKKIIQRISVWGDSVTKSVVFDEVKGRYETLKISVAAQCAKIFNMDIDNNSRFGATVTKGHKSLTRALERGVECDAIILEYGGNDCDYNWNEVALDPDAPHVPNTPLDAFRQTYLHMIDAVRKKGIQPVLLSLPPLDADRYFKWITRTGISRENILRFLGDIGHIYRHQERYSNAVTNIAMEQKCSYIDVRGAFLAAPNLGAQMCLDGIHPNDRGYRTMREAFVAYMKAREVE